MRVSGSMLPNLGSNGQYTVLILDDPAGLWKGFFYKMADIR
jgi:hypothetical protein